MKRFTTAGWAGAALLGAMLATTGVLRAQQIDAGAQLDVPRSPNSQTDQPRLDADVQAPQQQPADRQQQQQQRQDQPAARNQQSIQPRVGAEGGVRQGMQSGQFVQQSQGQLQLRDPQGQIVSQQLADGAVVVIDGREARLDDIRPGDTVRFQLGPDQRVTRLMVVRESQAPQGSGVAQPQEDRVLLGVNISESPTTGVYVRDVMPGGAAERGGIAARDYILSINGQKISSPQDFDQQLAQLRPGMQVRFEVWRNQQRQPVTVQITQQDTVLAHSQMQQSGQFQQDQRLSQAQPGQQQGQQSQDRSAAFRAGQQRAWLGVQLQEAEPAREGEQPGQGVIISDIYPAGPAARYGLFEGDRIVRVGDQQVTSAEQASQLIGQQKVGQAVPFVVRRGDQEVTVEVVLGNRSDFLFDEQPDSGVQGQQQGRAGYGDFSGDIPEHAMMLEQHRRFAEQHERMERMLYELKEEVRQLRQDLGQQKQNQNP